MKAAVVHDFTKPLSLEDVPKPEPGPGEVLVKVETAGLCHTDIHAAHGDWPVKPTPPFIPGHEGVGIVEQVGPGVSTPQVGDRVAMPWLGEACGVCNYCVDGWETLCEKQINTGYGIDGSYAEFATANAAYIAQVPDAVDSLDASVLTCAGVTTYKAVKLSGARPGWLVAIFGIGGLGHLALQYAKISGATVVAVDISDEKLALARELGADHVVNALIEDPVQSIQDLGGAGLTCAHHRHLPLYGGGWPDVAICVATLAAASSTAVLRVMSDRHYSSDALLGVGIGLASGWGLPEWLHYGAGDGASEDIREEEQEEDEQEDDTYYER